MPGPEAIWWSKQIGHAGRSKVDRSPGRDRIGIGHRVNDRGKPVYTGIHAGEVLPTWLPRLERHDGGAADRQLAGAAQRDHLGGLPWVP